MRKYTVTVRGVPGTVLRALRSAGELNRRSLNGELLIVLERAAVAYRDAPPAFRETTVAHASVPDSEPRRPLADAVDRDVLASVCRRHHIRSLAVFGSQVRGGARPDSDVDVVVEFEPGMTPGLGIEAVADALRPVLGGRRVDLVTRRGLSPRLREHVLTTAVPLYVWTPVGRSPLPAGERGQG